MSVPVPGAHPDDPDFVYDEMAYFGENCAEFGLSDVAVAVERVSHVLADGRSISALRWGSGPPRIVAIHGGAQNAHTWDTVALALQPAAILAVDLPGHGRSSWRDDQAYDPISNAVDVAEAIAALAPEARLVVGMSLGGLTSIALSGNMAAMQRLVLVDITPGVNAEKAKAVHDFIAGPQSFPSFGEIFDRTVEFNPTRTPESLRRGILHNAHRAADGNWEWNYDRRPMAELSERELELSGSTLWELLADSSATVLLVRGALSPVVDDDDVLQLQRLRPDASLMVVEGAGHSVQGDRPLELAALIEEELALIQ